MADKTSFVVLALFAGIVLGPNALAAVQLGSQGDIQYANGGFGLDEQQSMRELAQDFNLSLGFSVGKRGEFAAEVKLVISDKAGHQVLKLGSVGPLTHVKLPAGQYTVAAEYQGGCQRKSLKLGDTQGKRLYFNWPAKPE